MRALVLILIVIFQTHTTPCAIAKPLTTRFLHRGKQVRTVFSGSLVRQSAQLTEWSQEALQIAEERLDLLLLEDVEIYFDSDPPDHNGLATVVPRNRIVIHTEAPIMTTSIGLYRHYLLETLTHEWAHILSLQRYSGIFRPIDFIFGNTARPNGLWPRWIHEGIAVWTEEALGGRPQSGSIDFDLRVYAEYAQRKKVLPLQNSDLDGQWPLRNFQQGRAPYSFGYLILKEMSESNPQLIKKFSEASSRQLGLSFRKVFQELGHNLDEVFEKLSNKWAQQSLVLPSDSLKELSHAPEIYGLVDYNNRVSWIERGEFILPRLALYENFTVSKIEWPFRLLSPLKAYSLEPQIWVIYVSTVPAWLENSFYSSRQVGRRRLILYDEALGSPKCVFDLGEQIRELDMNSSSILWVKSIASGEHQIWRASWDLDCRISNKSLVYQSPAAFQRVSHPRILNNNEYTFTLNHLNKTQIQEQIIKSEKLSLFAKKQTPSKSFNRLQLNLEENEALVFENSKNYWGPLYLKKETSRILNSKQLPLRTGAQEALLGSEGIFVVENFWDQDRVRIYPRPQVQSEDNNHFIWQEHTSTEPLNVVDQQKALSIAPSQHSPIETIWPHFWMPSLSSSEGDWLIAGQTFYSDITQTWNGSTFLAYNTQIQRPNFNTFLSYRKNSKTVWPQIIGQLQYAPRDISYFSIPTQSVQERWNADLAFQFHFSLEQRWLGSLSLGLNYRYSGELGSFEAQSTRNPFSQFRLSTPSGFNPYTTLSSLSESQSFLYLEQRTRWLAQPEIQMETAFLWNSSTKSALLFVFEGAHTEPANFPQSFFVWGGVPLFNSALNENFLNRGFAPQSQAARQIFRASAEAAYRVANPTLAAKWNRLRLQSVDMRLIAESITWSSIFGNKYQLGRQYSSSLGTEWDFIGSSLHYLTYKMSLGVFRGFGENADTRFSAQLKVGLDI
jgi:hypothetical protein